jgi:hypothetical protein
MDFVVLLRVSYRTWHQRKSITSADETNRWTASGLPFKEVAQIFTGRAAAGRAREVLTCSPPHFRKNISRYASPALQTALLPNKTVITMESSRINKSDHVRQQADAAQMQRSVCGHEWERRMGDRKRVQR